MWIAVDVHSQQVLYLHYVLFSHWNHPILDDLSNLEFGIHAIGSAPGRIALDYIHGNIAEPRLFVLIPMYIP